MKHLVLIIEVIQHKRKFKCDHGPVLAHPDTFLSKTQPEDESMIKLAKFLADKKFRLIDMFRILNKNNSLEMDKDEFIKRMKIFEPRLTQKDIQNIANNLTNKETIYYSGLFYQISTKLLPENASEVDKKKKQLNDEEEKLKKINANKNSNNNNKDDVSQQSQPQMTKSTTVAKKVKLNDSNNKVANIINNPQTKM